MWDVDECVWSSSFVVSWFSPSRGCKLYPHLGNRRGINLEWPLIRPALHRKYESLVRGIWEGVKEKLASKPTYKRKMPYAQAGAHWHTFAAPKLYLEDLNYLYDIMLDYSDHSRTLHAIQYTYNAQASARQIMAELRKEGHSIEDFPSIDPPDPPVIMEVDDYIVYTVPDLQQLNLDTINEFEMIVGISDLRFSSGRFGISITTSRDDAPARQAFNEIRNRVTSMQNPITKVMYHRTTAVSFLAIIITINIVSTFVDGFFRDILSIAGLGLVLLFLPISWMAFEHRKVVVTQFRKDVKASWWASSELKIALVAALFVALLGIILGKL